MKKGAKAVIGYRDDLWIPRINEYEATPLRDPSAKPVLQVSNLVALKLLKGATAQEAVEASRRKTDELILDMLRRHEPYDSPTLVALLSNDAAIGFAGDPAATA